MTRRLPAFDIDDLLKFYIQGAELKDTYQSRQVHKYLTWMLKEHEVLDGRWWLTDFGRSVLIIMHDRLRNCPDQGKELGVSALDAVMLTPYNRRKT